MSIAELVWPLPRIGPRLPVISDPFSLEQTPLHRKHLGVDVMFRWAPGDDLGPPRTAATRKGKPVFSVPAGTPILAVADGIVIYAKLAKNGWRTRVKLTAGIPGLHVIDLHMSSLFVVAGARVHQGEPLGICGGDPTDIPRKLVHDHHEHRRQARRGEVPDSYGCVPTDPEPALARALIIEVSP